MNRKITFPKGSQVVVKSNNKEAVVTGHLLETWEYQFDGKDPSKLLAMLHYVDDTDPHAVCFLGEDKLVALKDARTDNFMI